MQGRQQICILCRNVGRPKRHVLHGRREASQKRLLEPYDATKLVLDLDAHDSEYVRNDQHEYSTLLPPLLPRNSPEELREANARKKARIRLDAKNAPDIYRPNPVDIIEYALTDNPLEWRTRGYLRRVLSSCLPAGLGKFEDHIKWLRSYEVLPSNVEKLLHGPHEDAVQGVEAILEDLKTVSDLDRIISLLTRTSEGCKFVASNGTIFLNKIISPSQRKLKCINAVVQRLGGMGVDAGPQWHRAGLETALKGLCGPALKKYIDIAVKRKDMFNLQNTLEHTLVWSFNARHDDENISVKDDLLKLLTGWENSGFPEGDEQRKLCLALLTKDDLGFYGAYIDALDRLQAYNALWYEFNHISPSQVSMSTSKNDPAVSFERVKIFERVFMRLRNPLQMLKFLYKQRQPRSSDADEFPSKSILSTPRISRDRKMKIRNALEKNYRSEGFSDIAEERLRLDLELIDMYTPQNMSDMMAMLSAYWTKKHDQEVRQVIAGYAPTSPEYQQAVVRINRRLDAIGEDWESRSCIQDWCMVKRVKRLKKLRDDLHNPNSWSRVGDDPT